MGAIIHPLDNIKGGYNKVRIDIQGSIFPTIRYAYSHSSSLENAHKLVLKRIKQLGRREDSVLYFDGDPAQEKQETHQQRANARKKALKVAEEKVDEFAMRVEKGLRIRKQQYINVNKNLTKGFCWDPEARESLIIYLEKENWTVTRSPTEADIQIATDCKDGDVVISGDSDLAIHPRVTMIWRPISGGRFSSTK
ncbi:hypothetical protein EC957_001747 [Mortierella hygrophila]|uniref:Uncharacterized protein n=1 Tax=Mortierella hygrophila TaxID=979708 RepID=A0A9P6F5Y4_9FUNG|nr:hypothetical protein EC957_001747 [Mortierella hygrophila]